MLIIENLCQMIDDKYKKTVRTWSKKIEVLAKQGAVDELLWILLAANEIIIEAFIFTVCAGATTSK
jgi:hypothetical protein